MPVNPEIQYARIDDLYLDPLNPRLGRNNTGPHVSQAQIQDLMSEWRLDELAVSFIESGFWPQEAVLVVKERLYEDIVLVVVEGNRRIAALKYLEAAKDGNPSSRKWTELVKDKYIPDELFERIPYIEVSSRKEIQAFLGFRHVTGIEQWKPAEKAEYISRLIDEEGMTYETVMRKIGSKTPTVRQLYIAYRLFRQMESLEGISVEHVEQEFSVLFLSLRTAGTRKYLSIDINAEPKDAQTPVPEARSQALVNYARWLFGTDTQPPLFTDSRLVDRFGHILESDAAVAYLERTENPKFEYADRIAGGDEQEITLLIESAADSIELALTRVHQFKKSTKVRRAVTRLASDAEQLLTIFPDLSQPTSDT